MWRVQMPINIFAVKEELQLENCLNISYHVVRRIGCQTEFEVGHVLRPMSPTNEFNRKSILPIGVSQHSHIRSKRRSEGIAR